MCLSVRLALSAVAFAFLLLTVAPGWSQWDQPGLRIHAQSGTGTPAVGEALADSSWGEASPRSALQLAMSSHRPTHRLSMARALLLLLTQRLPFFGLAWFAAQALVAAGFGLCLSRQLLGVLGACMCRRAWGEKGADDAERTPLCPK